MARDRPFRIMAALEGHFAADDASPADANRWHELKRHSARMKDGLDLVIFAGGDGEGV